MEIDGQELFLGMEISSVEKLMKSRVIMEKGESHGASCRLTDIRSLKAYQA